MRKLTLGWNLISKVRGLRQSEDSSGRYPSTKREELLCCTPESRQSRNPKNVLIGSHGSAFRRKLHFICHQDTHTAETRKECDGKGE